MRRALAALVGLVAAPLAAQRPDGTAFTTAARGGIVFESYSLGSGLVFERVSEVAIPVTLTQRLGRRLTVDLATAYARASVATIVGPIEISGPADTDVRAVYALVPGRALVTLVGTLPTGTATVPDTTLPLLGATATDLFGFTVPSLGAGGGVTAGLASAFRAGESWAVGIGASYRHNGRYVPLEGGEVLSPGAEGRVRLGLEGPLGRNAYFRAGLLYATSGVDQFAGGQQAVTGDRVLAHASLNLPLGRGALSLYGWEMHRFSPRGATTTYAAAAQVPRGNVVALGARLDRPVSPTLAVAPTLELRHELSGRDTLALLGYLVRPGVNLRYRLSGRVALLGTAQLAYGRLRDEGVTVDVLGPRIGFVLEWLR